jgi:hypothetical protein
VADIQRKATEFENELCRKLKNTISEYLASSKRTYENVGMAFTRVEESCASVDIEENLNLLSKSSPSTFFSFDEEGKVVPPAYHPVEEARFLKIELIGRLKRKQIGLFSKGWKAGSYVLTSAGYIHAFEDDGAELLRASASFLDTDKNPAFSIYLPNCSMGIILVNTYEFELIERLDGRSYAKGRVASHIVRQDDGN